MSSVSWLKRTDFWTVEILARARALRQLLTAAIIFNISDLFYLAFFLFSSCFETPGNRRLAFMLFNCLDFTLLYKIFFSFFISSAYFLVLF